MKRGEMDRFMAHCDHHFQQTDCTVLHPEDPSGLHIDVLLYEPNEAYPFWKLVTMGASDYQMPGTDCTLGDRNEYMMFIDSSENLKDRAIAGWYYSKLLGIAHYPPQTTSHLTYGHSVEWGDEEGTDMVAAFLEMPQVIGDATFLRCKLGILKQTICLQVVLLTRAEMEQLLSIGPQEFSEFLYPEEEGREHFLCERNRTSRF